MSFRSGGAVEGEEGVEAARGAGVDGASDEFFAGAGFAGDEDGDIGGANFMNLFEDETHSAAGADEAGEFHLFKQAGRVEYLCAPVFASERDGFKSLLDDIKQRLNVDGICQESLCLRTDDVEQEIRLLIVRHAVNIITAVFIGREL